MMTNNKNLTEFYMRIGKHTVFHGLIKQEINKKMQIN